MVNGVNGRAVVSVKWGANVPVSYPSAGNIAMRTRIVTFLPQPGRDQTCDNHPNRRPQSDRQEDLTMKFLNLISRGRVARFASQRTGDQSSAEQAPHNSALLSSISPSFPALLPPLT